MNVEKEIAAIDRKVRAQIDASARAALIRIGVDPDEEARRAAERAEAERLAAIEAHYANLGRALTELGRSFAAAVRGLSRGAS